MNTMDTTQPIAGAQAPPLSEALESDLPVLVAALYDEAPVGLRQRLLNQLLRPVGPLALVAVATGAFASLLPEQRWHVAQARVDDALRIQADQVLDLALYVQQKSPEMLWRLAEAVASSPLVLGTLSGALLLALLSARQRADARR